LSRNPVPSECHYAAEGIAYTNATQWAALNSLVDADRCNGLEDAKAYPAGEDSTLTDLEAEIAYLSKVFATTPDHFETEHTDDPTTYAEAMQSEHASQWTAAMQEEFKSLHKLGVYKLVPHSTIPAGCKIMKGQPVFKLKHDQHGNPARFKARYICHGYSAVWGQDYTKTSAPTACLESFCILAHIGAALDWEIEQLDIKTTFLYGLLNSDEVCYMEQPDSFIEPGFEDHVWELQKGLYGMKQGGLIWNRTLNEAMLSWGSHV
jgi:hypothetical protein